MRIKKNIILTLLFASVFTPSYSQILKETDPIPQGAVIYSLPQTSIRVQVTVEVSKFTAGPYASFAAKYFGSAAKNQNTQSCKIQEIQIQPLVESDPKVTIAANIGTSKNASANFLNFSSQGLIVAPGFYSAADANFAFPSLAQKSLNEQVAPTANKRVTTYKTVVNEDGDSERIATTQTQTIERDLQKRAEYTAEIIHKLREKKIEIITGDTDANYAGEALSAAVNEMNRLDAEYSSLFYGTTAKAYQTLSFDIVPDASNTKQTYILFKISDTHGILPANSSNGKPVYLEIVPEGKINSISAEDVAVSKGKIAYRTPVASKVRVLEDGAQLSEARVLVYQFGKVQFFPIELATGR